MAKVKYLVNWGPWVYQWRICLPFQSQSSEIKPLFYWLSVVSNLVSSLVLVTPQPYPEEALAHPPIPQNTFLWGVTKQYDETRGHVTTFVSTGLDNKKRKLFRCFDNGFCFPNCENVLLYNYLKQTCAYFLQLAKSLFNTEGVTSYKSVKLSTTICHSQRQGKTFKRSLVINITIITSRNGQNWTLPLQRVTQWVQNLKKIPNSILCEIKI